MLAAIDILDLDRDLALDAVRSIGAPLGFRVGEANAEGGDEVVLVLALGDGDGGL